MGSGSGRRRGCARPAVQRARTPRGEISPWRRRMTAPSEDAPPRYPREYAPSVARCATRESVFGVARSPRKRDRVAHVGKPRDVGDGALETEAKARVRHAAVAAEIPAPAHRFLVDADLAHAGVEHVEPLLALAAADDLTDAGREDVHRRHGSAVVVDAHVEGLDGLRVVHDDDRALGVSFGEVALVLRL